MMEEGRSIAVIVECDDEQRDVLSGRPTNTREGVEGLRRFNSELSERRVFVRKHNNMSPDTTPWGAEMGPGLN